LRYYAIAAQIAEARKNASDIKGSLYALGKNPEHLTERQKTRLEWLAQNNERLYRAYGRKEQLRLISTWTM
jgi:transposase